MKWNSLTQQNNNIRIVLSIPTHITGRFANSKFKIWMKILNTKLFIEIYQYTFHYC